jgi:hypothetical protein
MEPRIIEKDQIILVGFSFFGDPFATSAGWTEENEIGRVWQRLMAYLEIHFRNTAKVTTRCQAAAMPASVALAA